MTERLDTTVPFITAPNISSDTHKTSHGFFSRLGGVSTGIYASLNAGPGSDDLPANVARNRELCAAAIGIVPNKIPNLYQIHSADVVTASEAWATPPQADGVVTKTRGIAISVLSADCMPFLFSDPIAGVIGAAHAGWRGALTGVIENTIKRMTDIGASPQNIKAALGPCIRQKNFEVGMDLVDAFVSKHPNSTEFFKPGISSQKRQFDLAAFGLQRLREVGVTDIYDTDICTFDDDRYFSHRGSSRDGFPDFGRNLSAIALI